MKYSLFLNSIRTTLLWSFCVVLFDLTVLLESLDVQAGVDAYACFSNLLLVPFDRMSHDQIKSIRADVEEYCSVLCYALIVQPNLALSVLSDLP